METKTKHPNSFTKMNAVLLLECSHRIFDLVMKLDSQGLTDEERAKLASLLKSLEFSFITIKEINNFSKPVYKKHGY